MAAVRFTEGGVVRARFPIIEHIVTCYLIPRTSEPVERARCTCGWSYRGATGHRRELLNAIEVHDRRAPAGLVAKEDA